MERKATRQISVWLTDEQHAALMAVVPKFGRSEFIRDALKQAVESAGGEWPDNMPEMGAALNPQEVGVSNT